MLIHGSSPFSSQRGLVGSLSSQWGRGGFENYYTDGVFGARNTAQEEFGKSRCKEFLESQRDVPAAPFANAFSTKSPVFPVTTPVAHKRTTLPSASSTSKRTLREQSAQRICASESPQSSRRNCPASLSRVIVLLAFSIFLNYVDRSTLSIAATLLKEDLGLSSSQFGTLLSYPLSSAPMSSSKSSRDR